MQIYPLNIQDILFELANIDAPETECTMFVDKDVLTIKYKINHSDKGFKVYQAPSSWLSYMVEVAETGDQLDVYDTYAEAEAKIKEYFEEDTEDVDIDDLKTRREIEASYEIRAVILPF